MCEWCNDHWKRLFFLSIKSDLHLLYLLSSGLLDVHFLSSVFFSSKQPFQFVLLFTCQPKLKVVTKMVCTAYPVLLAWKGYGFLSFCFSRLHRLFLLSVESCWIKYANDPFSGFVTNLNRLHPHFFILLSFSAALLPALLALNARFNLHPQTSVALPTW